MSGLRSRRKGVKGESELVAVLDELGLPSIRVLGSGAFNGAKADIKAGIELNPDGTKPEADECKAIMRLECKNRADNPEHLHTTLNTGNVSLVLSTRQGSESVWNYYNQDSITKAVALRRSKIPKGALTNKDYNQVWMICMGIEDFVELVRKANGI